jgi:anti-sigma factor RsiW
MTFGHVFNRLAAYADGELDPAERDRVEQHLAGCAECRQSLGDIRTGIALASNLRPEPMPAELAARLRQQLTAANPATAPGARVIRTWRYAAAAAVLVLAATGVYWQVNRPWVNLQAAAGEPNAFEREGRELHRRITSGDAPLAFQSADERALWQWLADQRAPVTSMDIARPASQRGQFIPIGAAVHELDGARTSVLSYRIDGRPVTLALASSASVPNAPPAGWWTKRVTHRRDAAGVNTLTWTVGGGTYVMVSELAGAGQKACLICHTTDRFTNAVTRLSVEGANVRP